MKKVLPEVELATGFTWFEKTTWQVGDKILKEQGRNASADFFRMFSYPLVQGTPATALATLRKPRHLPENGQRILWQPAGSHRAGHPLPEQEGHSRSPPFSKTCPRTPPNQFRLSDQLRPTWLDDNSWAKSWGNNGPLTIVMLRKDADPIAFAKKIAPFPGCV